MTSGTAFNAIAQTLIDEWLHKASPIEHPEALYSAILEKLTFKMSLNFIDTSSDDPLEWQFRCVKAYGFKSRLLNLNKWFPDGSLGDLPDQAYLADAVLPHYSRALRMRRPLIDLVQTRVGGINVGYDRLIVPQKSEERPRWLVTVTEGRFMFTAPVEAKLDVIDEEIVQLLIEGETAKEIAPLLNLSQRTIEHRIDKMKARYDARNVVHLTAKLFSIHMDRRISEDRATAEELS